jgi:hypothetical protein
LLNFIKCPFCAGHEAVSPETAHAIESMIEAFLYVDEHPRPEALETELWNIRNAILNHQERDAEVDPLLT